VIASAIIILVIFFLYALFTPITIEASNVPAGEKKTVIRIKIFPFGFVVPNSRTKIGKRKRGIKSARKSGKTVKKSGLLSYIFFNLELTRHIAVELIHFCNSLIRCPHKYYLQLSLSGGLKEPHLTGQLYGIICAASPILPESIRISYDPDFIDDSIRANYRIGLKFYLAAVFFELFRILFRLPLIKIIGMIWEYRKENQYAYQN
jgi:hypothetical protein